MEPDKGPVEEAARASGPTWRRWLPLGLFVGGFVFDALTLGREVNPINLAVVSFYATAVWSALWLRTRELPERFDRWAKLGLHFCLGSLFSALVVLYFKSAGHLYALLVVLGLFGAMVWNEFSQRDDSQRELLWGIACVSLVMLLNFLIPHVLKSVAAGWFYVSTIMGVGAVAGLWLMTRQPWKMLRVPTGASALLIGLFMLGWIPPVPLVLESSLVGVAFEKTGGEYTCLVEGQGLLARAGLRDPVVRYRRGEGVSMLTAVSAPRDAVAKVEHRWYRHVDGQWQQTDTIPVALRGGRKQGWRFWSTKRHVQPGRWKVETALQDGAVLGVRTFRLEEIGAEVEVERTRRAL